MSYSFSPSQSHHGLIDRGGIIFQGGVSPSATKNPLSIHEGSSSEEISANSITSRIDNFFLKTPTISNPPEFSLSPIYSLEGTLNTPSSMANPTPVLVQGSFQSSPNVYGISGYNGTPGGNYANADDQFDLVTSTSPRQRHSNAALQDSFVPFRNTSGVETELEYDEEPAFVSSIDFATEKHAFSFDNLPLSSGGDDITIEEFLLQVPLESIEKVKELGENLIPPEAPILLPNIIEFTEEVPESSPKKSSSHVKSKIVEGQVGFSPRVIRKTKSFSAAITKSSKDFQRPKFSFEECANEFHITDGNYAFQDETATVSMQCDPGTGSTNSKKKSISKLSKVIPKPTLRKSKSTFNLCLQVSYRSNPKVLRNMESGLLSFQLQLKTLEHNRQQK